MGAAIRAFDWAQTPLGPIAAWSPSLRMMVRVLLANRFPLLLWWGPQYVSIYNDAYRPVLGTKHPWALGQPVRTCWSEIWPVLQPLIDTPFHGGPATWIEDLSLEINRYGFVEETHFTVAYSPVPDETVPRGIGGVLATVHEISAKVVGERRVAVLKDLGTHTAAAQTATDAGALAAATLTQHPRDLPFALLYLLEADGQRARLAGAAGVAMGTAVSPHVIELSAPPGTGGVWPLADAVRTDAIQVVDDLATRGAPVPPGPWSDPPQAAAIVPIHAHGAHQLAGVLVAGLSARLRFDHLYRSFLELVATQIATALANARAYEEERTRADALATLDRAKTTFFSNVSHEFRTPLTLMLGPVADLLAHPEEQLLPDQRALLTIAHRNGVRIQKLVNTLLDFAGIEAGRLEARYVPLDLAAATADLASTFRSACERAGLRFVVDCPALPAPVYVDQEMWEKIVLNLLSNAFKYTLAGEIAVRLHWGETCVALTVRDTGTGIPASALPHLFERFYRLPNARARTQEGTGIGLALVQELVRLHGGQITVASTVDVGTTFTVTIPTGAGHLPTDRVGVVRPLASTALATDAYVAEALQWLPEEAPRPPTVPSPRLPVPASPFPPVLASALPPGSAPPRILVADDNADMRAYVQRLLSPHWQVETVADGTQALAAVRVCVPDLVLTDVMMPGLDGFALLHALRTDPRTATLPVLLLSARAGEEARVEGLAAGADDYLVKPFAARELLARVEAHLTLKRLRDETQATVRAYATQLEHALEALQSREEALRQHNDLLLATRREIEQERARYAALFALAPEGALVTDAAGVIQEANPAAAALLGVAPSALLGTPLRRYVTQTQRRSFARLLTRLQTQARAQDWETQLQPRHGRPVPASLTVAVRRSPAGQAPALHWLLRDITARKQAEAELERRRQETVLLAELAQELSASLDLDTVLQRIVTGAQALCGSARTLIALRDPGTEVLVSRYAMGAATLASADWRLAPGEGLGGQVLRTGQPWRTADYATDPRFSEVELAGARAAGPLAVLAVPIRMAGRVEGVLYASKPAVQPFTDWDEEILVRLATHAALALQNAQLYQQAQAELAERRTAEAALARAAAELEQRVAERTAALHEAMAERQRLEREAQRVQHFALLGRLAAGVSHEIRNPLAAVFLHVDVLAEELGDPAPDSAALVADTLTDIRTQLGRLEDLVQDYLSLVRVAQLERTPEDLGAALRTWAMEWQALAIARGHRCQLAGLDDVGMVAVHANTLRRALLNLVQNALDAMPQGGTLTLRGYRTATAVVLQVQDTGSGIPPATSTQIFEPLYTTKPGGTGLGLYIVQEIVAAHGGQVTVESVVGQGTTFTLTLPLAGGASDVAGAP